jgi:hypothetical protein
MSVAAKLRDDARVRMTATSASGLSRHFVAVRSLVAIGA